MFQRIANINKCAILQLMLRKKIEINEELYHMNVRKIYTKADNGKLGRHTLVEYNNNKRAKFQQLSLIDSFLFP